MKHAEIKALRIKEHTNKIVELTLQRPLEKKGNEYVCIDRELDSYLTGEIRIHRTAALSLRGAVNPLAM